MEFFSEISAMTGNQPLREISERLYFQTSRIVLKLMPRLNLAEEFAAFRREMEDILRGDGDRRPRIRSATSAAATSP